MFSFSKKISSAFKLFDKGFEEVDAAMKEAEEEMEKQRLTMSSRKQDGDTIEQETVVEETKPDGTKVVTRTIVRTTKKGT